MVAVFEIKDVSESQRLRDRVVVLLVVQNPFADRPRAGFLIVGGPDQASPVSFTHKLGHRARRIKWDVIRMGLYRRENLTRVRPAWERSTTTPSEPTEAECSRGEEPCRA